MIMEPERHRSEELVAEINQLVAQRRNLKRQSKWNEADEIQQKLWEAPYFVKVVDGNNNSHNNHNHNNNNNNNGSSSWTPRIFNKQNEPPVSVVWTKVVITRREASDLSWQKNGKVPWIIGTVDTPTYRARYKETIQHLDSWQKNCSCSNKTEYCSSIQVEPPVHLLDVNDYPSLGVKKILFEGWRQKLLPKLMNDYLNNTTTNNNDEPKSGIEFLFVAEDDIRIPEHVTPCRLVEICHEMFQLHPHLHVLSLGHSWSDLRNHKKFKDKRKPNLIEYLQQNHNTKSSSSSAGVHGSTLCAIRLPGGLKNLQDALNAAAIKKKQTHLDQFLFFSPHHNLTIALSDPPLVGWAEVESTLTQPGSGHRRLGGGRFGFLPSAPTTSTTLEGLSWVQRKLVAEQPEKK